MHRSQIVGEASPQIVIEELAGVVAVNAQQRGAQSA